MSTVGIKNNNNKNNCIIIASLPRSGSTVLQRILATDTRYSTQDETWVFPFISSNFIDNGVKSILGHKTALKRINEVSPDLEERLLRFIVNSVLLENEGYYIEKTPRNYFSIKSLNNINQKVIIIVRNPALILASSMNNLFDGKLRHIHGYIVDYKEGVEHLVDGKNSPLNDVLKYEELEHINYLDFGLNVELNSLVTLDNSIGDKNKSKSFILQNDIKKYKLTFLESIVALYLLKKYFKNYCDSFGYSYKECRKLLYKELILFRMRKFPTQILGLVMSLILIFIYQAVNFRLEKSVIPRI